MRRILFSLLFLMAGTTLFGQFDAFKYVVVPAQFDVFNQANMHKTSTMVKYYLDQRGYPAVYDLGRPPELKESPCLAVYTRLVDDSNLFATRVNLRFEDCEGKIVFETQQGRSKLKDYHDSYKQAIEEAFTSLDGMQYTYSPPSEASGSEADAGKAADAEKAAGAVQASGGALQATEPSAAQVSAAAAAEAAASPMQVSGSPAASVSAKSMELSETNESAGELWYAQEVAEGYQLVDSTPKVRMRLLPSSRGEGVFMAVVEGEATGTVYREGDTWIHEYFEDGQIVRKSLNIKF